MPSPFPPRPKGFSLVEVALALAVMGLIGAMTFPLLSHLLTQQKINRAEIILESARSEVLGYAMRTKNLPAEINSIGHQQDAWRNALRFKAASYDEDDLCLFFATNATATLKITISGDTISNLAFILVSSGPNRLPQTELADDPVLIPAPGTEVDGKRYDDLHVFMTMDYLRTRIDCPKD